MMNENEKFLEHIRQGHMACDRQPEETDIQRATNVLIHVCACAWRPVGTLLKRHVWKVNDTLTAKHVRLHATLRYVNIANVSLVCH